MGLTVGVLEAFSVPSYTSRSNLPAVALLLLSYLSASAAIVHCAEKLFSEPSVAQLVVLSGNFLVGLVRLEIGLEFPGCARSPIIIFLLVLRFASS